MTLYARIADLPLEISGYSLEPLESSTPGGWTRRTTVIRLRGAGAEGVGEDVNYSGGDQLTFQKSGTGLQLAGRHTLDGFSRHLDSLQLFAEPPATPTDPLFRRWAFESAALDLALRQARRSLAEALGRNADSVTFVVSMGLGKPASVEPVRRHLELYPEMAFKLDLSASWSRELIDELEQTDAVRTVDLKGLYRGSFQGPPADVAQYRWCAERLRGAWLEDPELNDETRPALEPYKDRITWDANLHSLGDLLQLPFEPRCINIKPSRFGLLSELLRVYEYCEARGIAMYGGGQFELGPGRGQIQYLASLFHADAPNDVAPVAFNETPLRPGLPVSPLAPTPARTGFTW